MIFPVVETGCDAAEWLDKKLMGIDPFYGDQALIELNHDLMLDIMQ